MKKPFCLFKKTISLPLNWNKAIAIMSPFSLIKGQL